MWKYLAVVGLVFIMGCGMGQEATSTLVGGATKGLDTYYNAPFNFFTVDDAATYTLAAKAPEETRVVEKYDADGKLIARETFTTPAYDTVASQTGTVSKRAVRMRIQQSIPYERQPVVNRGLIGGFVEGFLAYIGLQRVQNERHITNRMYDSMDKMIDANSVE